MSEIQTTLIQTRASAVAIHGALLNCTRLGWERRHGRISDSMTLLRLITEDPEFMWIAPLTTLIASLDEALADGTPESLSRAALMGRAIVDLLKADENGSAFQARYFRELNSSPDLALIAARARPGLQSAPRSWS